MKVIKFENNVLYNDQFIVYFTESAGGGTLSFTDNLLSNSLIWTSNEKIIFKLIDGSGNYLFADGFVVVNTDNKHGRQFFVYFFKE